MKSFTLATTLFTLLSTAFSAPLADPSAEPEIQMLNKRAPATVFTKCTRANTVALTFDDGPYVYQQDLVNYLNSQNIKATFFVNGNNWRCIYDQGAVDSLKSAFNTGHMIGSHTWAHLDLSQQSWDKIHDEMWRVELAMRRILGRAPAFMRPPYGNYNDLVREASGIRNQSIVNWDFDSGDSVGVPIAQQKQRYTDIANQHPSNILALNHETQSSTVYDLIPFAVGQLKAKGYTFATVAECLNMQPYSWTGTPESRTADWHC